MPLSKTDRKHLLFVHQGALGDFIVTFPVLRLLRTGFVRVDGICRTDFGRLAKHLALIDTFYPRDAARFASLYSTQIDPRVADLLQVYDRVLLFSFSETLEQSVRHVIGDAVHRVAPWPRKENRLHVTEFLFHQLKESGLALNTGQITANEGCRAQKKTDLRDVNASGWRIILCPGAGSRAKRWPLAGYLQVAEMLAEIGHRPEFVLGPAEGDLLAEFAAGAAADAPVHRPQDLVQLADLLQSANGYIGNDSAVSHLAAFLGVPAVVVFGPSNPDRWRPMGPRVTVLQAADRSDPGWDRVKAGGIESAGAEQISPAKVLKSVCCLMNPEHMERSTFCS